MTPELDLALELPFSTAECDQGPVMHHARGRAELAYDAEGTDGVVWTEIAFTFVSALAFTPERACPAWMIEAYSRVCEVADSDWRERLNSQTGGPDASVPASSRHFVLYFDHVGCWEVLADNAEVVATA